MAHSRPSIIDEKYQEIRLAIDRQDVEAVVAVLDSHPPIAAVHDSENGEMSLLTRALFAFSDSTEERRIFEKFQEKLLESMRDAIRRRLVPEFTFILQKFAHFYLARKIMRDCTMFSVLFERDNLDILQLLVRHLPRNYDYDLRFKGRLRDGEEAALPVILWAAYMGQIHALELFLKIPGARLSVNLTDLCKVISAVKGMAVKRIDDDVRRLFTEDAAVAPPPAAPDEENYLGIFELLVKHYFNLGVDSLVYHHRPLILVKPSSEEIVKCVVKDVEDKVKKWVDICGVDERAIPVTFFAGIKSKLATGIGIVKSNALALE